LLKITVFYWILARFSRKICGKSEKTSGNAKANAKRKQEKTKQNRNRRGKEINK